MPSFKSIRDEMTKFNSGQAEIAVKLQSKGNNTKTAQGKVTVLLHCNPICIIPTNTIAKFQVNQTREDEVLPRTKNWTPPMHLPSETPTCMVDPIIHPVFEKQKFESQYKFLKYLTY